MINVSDKFVGKNHNTRFIFNNFNIFVYEVMLLLLFTR